MGLHGRCCCVGKTEQVLLFISEKIEFIQTFFFLKKDKKGALTLA